MRAEAEAEAWNAQMLSFPIKYNTMGSKVDGFALKTAILAARFLDHLTLDCPFGSHLKNFWGGNGKWPKTAFFKNPFSCGSFWAWELFKGSYCCSKSDHGGKSKSVPKIRRCVKKRHGHNFWISWSPLTHWTLCGNYFLPIMSQ